jgi:hypothetical protein
MEHILELDWPQLSTTANGTILNEFEIYQNATSKISKEINYYHLNQWDNHINFLNSIFAGYNITNEYLKHITIQQSVNGLPPHTDYARTVSAIYLIEGIADTVFYKSKDEVKPATKFDKLNLTEAARYRLEINKWYLFNNAEIHSVENSIGSRVSLTFDLTHVFGSYRNAVKQIASSKVLFV